MKRGRCAQRSLHPWYAHLLIGSRLILANIHPGLDKYSNISDANIHANTVSVNPWCAHPLIGNSLILHPWNSLECNIHSTIWSSERNVHSPSLKIYMCNACIHWFIHHLTMEVKLKSYFNRFNVPNSLFLIIYLILFYGLQKVSHLERNCCGFKDGGKGHVLGAGC